MQKKANITIFMILLSVFSLPSNAAQVENYEDFQAEEGFEGDDGETASARTVRRFHDVLDELLAEFGHDVKTGQMNDLKNLAVRRVSVSEALPQTYRKYVAFLITERIQANSTLKIIACIPCQTRVSKLVGGNIMIVSPATNLSLLKSSSETLGIENFLDIILIYHTTHMVMGVQVSNTKTNETVWTRTYNSETIKSRYQKLAIDYSQVAKSRVTDEYQPDYRFLIGVGGARIPNVGGTEADSGMIDLQFRGTERFNRRRMEFGLLMTVHLTFTSFLTAYPLEQGTGTEPKKNPDSDELLPAKPQPYQYAMSFYGIYAQNFLGSVESYDSIRHGLHAGLGGFLTLGYIAPLLRVGWDIFFGRRFTLSFAGIYLAPSKILVEETFLDTDGGLGIEAILSFNF